MERYFPAIELYVIIAFLSITSEKAPRSSVSLCRQHVRELMAALKQIATLSVYSVHFTLCNHLVKYCPLIVYVATPSRTGHFEKEAHTRHNNRTKNQSLYVIKVRLSNLVSAHKS
jgi:hypothetical protein